MQAFTLLNGLSQLNDSLGSFDFRSRKAGCFKLENLLQMPVSPKPFLRWAGGKRKLAPLIAEIIPNEFDGTKNAFYEPFVGGGALALYLGDSRIKHYVPGVNLILNDVNPDLICTYRVIRDSLEELLKYLKRFENKTDKQTFEKMRNYEPRNNIERAGRFIYLNKTCFNGLWRVNSKGEFNVPWGKLKNPKIFEETELRLVSMRLKGSHIRNTTYTNAMSDVNQGDLVYLDPPYIPLSTSSSFSKYSKDDFGILDQYALAGAISGLTHMGVSVILSNSDTKLTREIFGDVLDFRQIQVKRNISASSKSRISVDELIGVNFKIPSDSYLAKMKAI